MNASTQVEVPLGGAASGGKQTSKQPQQANQTQPNAAVDLNTQTESNHDTALTLACAGGHVDLVNLLLQRGAHLEHKDKKVNTLHTVYIQSQSSTTVK